MIVETYHKCSGGVSWVNWIGPAEVIIEWLARPETQVAVTEDGDNGFVGTMSVPQSIVPTGVETDPGFYPGSGGGCRGRRLVAVKAEYLREIKGLPAAVANALAPLWTPAECVAADADTAKKAIVDRWTAATWVAAAVIAGDLTSEWLPPGARPHLHSKDISNALDRSKRTPEQMCALLTRLCPKCRWHWGHSCPALVDQEAYVYRKGDCVFTHPYHGGVIFAVLQIVDNDNDPFGPTERA